METKFISCDFFQINSSGFEQLKVPKFFPNELILKILSFLSHRELCSCCLVSKNWKKWCEDPFLWQGWGKQLNIKETEINKPNVIKKIIELKENAQNAWPLLNQPVKTAVEFDAIGTPIVLNNRELTEKDQAILDNLFNEMSKKRDLGEKIERGFQAHLLLRRIGISSLEKMESFAQVLQIKYEQDTAYTKLVLELVGENQLAKVEEFLTSALKKDTIERNYVIGTIIDQLCDQGKIQEAFDFLQKYIPSSQAQKKASYILNSLDTIKKGFYLSSCLDTLLAHAEDKKLFPLWESIISTYIPHQERCYNVILLIETLIEEKMVSKAEELLQTYQKDLESQKERYALRPLIGIYVSLGKIQDVWDLVLNYQGDDNLLLYILRNSFARFHMKEEEEKAEKMIKAKEANLAGS